MRENRIVDVLSQPLGAPRHYDAKVWPAFHPYGSGSLGSELGSGGLSRLVRSRLLLVQSCFRNSVVYAFWFLHRLITKVHLYVCGFTIC